MKLIISLGLIAYASAQKDCSSFLKVSSSRSKRSPQYGWNDDVTTTGWNTRTTATASTAKPTTQPGYGNSATTTESAPITEGQQGSTTTEYAPMDFSERSYLVLLDATGSMQKLGGPGRGRDEVIKTVNKFIRNFKAKVEDDEIPDGPIAFVTFNKQAWVEYSSIKDMNELTRRDYNPGYATNLYDSMGCSLQKFKTDLPANTQTVYVISDGFHQWSSRTIFSAPDVNTLVKQYRTDGMSFTFYAMIDYSLKETLRQNVQAMGMRNSEIRTADFQPNSLGNILRSILSKSSKGGKKQDLKPCKEVFPCPKGRAGGLCRQERKLHKGTKCA